MPPPPKHPNPALHATLVQAAKDKRLDGKFIQRHLKLASPPHEEGNSSAYVNWCTTLSLLGRAPAKVWFSGVSRLPQDQIRDALSVGVYYWSVDKAIPPESYFWVTQFEDFLFIDVFTDQEIVALYLGTATMNCQIAGGSRYFYGDGLWSTST
ncbi:hypothetical protein GALMADRAFT_277501 [Galerina marginata CBS 339.88]|uniref:Uncharacterized protein n=1 Tax=Galerina marginata (strain CBS 339.88) TaxID=685588 RepID=A0A067TK47_GALM3|nr:hypothetical protein GALMADRAFT_277501 [Galerina marginata CBS 339.88]